MATFDDWLEAYSEVYQGGVDAPCPHCGHRTLRLVFTGDVEKGIGYAHFWCDNCLRGIGISRAHLPAGAIVRDIHLPPERREPQIPHFTFVA
jgi:hypothetical protein